MNDNNPLNDVSYVLNKEMMIKGLDNVRYTLGGGISTSFDEYSYWSDYYEFGANAVLQSYERGNKSEVSRELTEEERHIALDNISQNVIGVARCNPDVEFYIFYPPYSIVWWDSINNSGMVDYYIETMRMLTEEALEYKNINVFDFFGNYQLVCDLDNYKDYVHYSAEINSKILFWIRENKFLLTKDNYNEHFEELRDFYLNYDYDNLFSYLDVNEEGR